VKPRDVAMALTDAAPAQTVFPDSATTKPMQGLLG
jgi:hypothetical protein